MKKIYMMALAVGTLVAVSSTVQAIPINGSLNFEGGTVHLNGSLTTATAITAFGGAPIVNGNLGVAPTGSYAGTQGSAVTFGSGFTFSPSASYVDAPPLWTFTYLGNVYSFDLKSVSSSVGVGPSLDLAGTGVLSITGYTDTTGNFTFAATGVGTGPDTFTFGFVAGNNTFGVPDGASTALLLGCALTGVGLLRRKFAV
jgi:hypothetical protein